MNDAKPSRSATGSWVVYDVANSLFWTGVVGLSFPLWLTKDLGGSDATLGYVLAATMAVVIIASPIMGAISDQLGRRIPLLIGSTVVCVAATLLLGKGGLTVSLSLFALAVASMELGTIIYNALLPDVSTPSTRGLVSGLGQGIGYVGAIIAVVVALFLTGPKGYVFVLHVVAILFLIFALPIFVLLRERRRPVLPSPPLQRIGQALSQLHGNMRNLHRFPGLRVFLLSRFFYAMGINTAVAFAVVYASQTIGMSDREIQLILMVGIAIAIPSGVLWGVVADRYGAHFVLSFSLLAWVGLMVIAVAIPWLDWSRHLWWLVGSMVGVAMAGVWTADRPYMLSFVPEEYIGEFFGLHATVGKLGRVIGPVMWAIISGTLGFGQPAALASLVGCLVAAYVILARLGRRRVPAQAPAGASPDAPEITDGP